jgi:hypothetical protein
MSSSTVGAHDGSEILFEYAPEALRRGIELSPRHLPLRAEAYGGFPPHQQRLPGLLADSLPDGWGMLLMDRLFRKQGRPPADISPLDQLGGSPHGSRPKVLVQFVPATGELSTLDHPGWGRPWLVKFPAQNEHKEVCAIEQVYAELARSCGLDVPETRHFNLGPRLTAFGTRSFDREDGMRVPLHTLAGLLHADFRLPSLDGPPAAGRRWRRTGAAGARHRRRDGGTGGEREAIGAGGACAGGHHPGYHPHGRRQPEPADMKKAMWPVRRTWLSGEGLGRISPSSARRRSGIR